MRVCFLLARRVPPVPSPLLVEVEDRLRRRDLEVAGGIVEELLTRPELLSPGYDLYVLKSHTELALSLAGILHDQGARFLNPYGSCVATQDKLVAARRLAAADVPVPRSWTTGDLRLVEPLLARGPLVIKPHRGHRGASVHVVHDPGQLAALPKVSAPVIVQEYVPGPGEDLKVYVVGEEVYAVRKPFGPDSFTRPGRPCRVSREVRDIALRAGAALGLGLFGLDLIEGPQGPVVVDANYFPGYKGVPGVGPRIAEYVERFARGKITLETPDLPHVLVGAG
jgi:ribosomal protein S6--L-glutamate ligase